MSSRIKGLSIFENVDVDIDIDIDIDIDDRCI